MATVLWILVAAQIFCCFSFNFRDQFFGNLFGKDQNNAPLEDESALPLDPNQTLLLVDQFLQYNRNNGILGDSKTNPESESQFLSKLDKDGSGKITPSELKTV